MDCVNTLKAKRIKIMDTFISYSGTLCEVNRAIAKGCQRSDEDDGFER